MTRLAGQAAGQPYPGWFALTLREHWRLSFSEALVAFGVLVLVAALGISMIRQPAVASTSPTGAQEITALLREARALAAHGSEARVYVDLENRQVMASWQRDVFSLPSDVAVAATYRSGPVRHAIAAFAFMPDGSATGGAIRVQSTRLREVIEIDWLSGSIVRSSKPLEAAP